MKYKNKNSRREFLRYAGATGAAVGLSGVALPTAASDDVVETFELIGFTGAWEGVAPDDIAGVQNPTLRFEEVGGRYRVEWENGDGIGHNFVILDGDGNSLVSSAFLTGRGDTDTVEFEATEDMARYICEPHSSTMVGDIALGPADQYADLREEVDIAFEATSDGWIGITPAEIDGVTNPTIELAEGEEYEFAIVRAVNRDDIALTIADEDDTELFRSFVLNDHNLEERFTIEATTDMATYFADVEPDVMRGDIAVEPSEDDEREQAIASLIEEADYVFDGLTPGWVGLYPESIEGAENPTIELDAGESSVFGWINGDGDPHNIAIRDADDNSLHGTEITDELNATQTLTFEATPDAVSYICDVHPTTMVGDLVVEGDVGNGVDDDTDDTTDDSVDDADDDGAGFGVASAIAGGAGVAAAMKYLADRNTDSNE